MEKSSLAHQRFVDIETVPNLFPIDLTGICIMSLEDATKSLIDQGLVENLTSHVHSSLSYARSGLTSQEQIDLKKKYNLTEDDIAAINLFTHEWEKREDSLYFIMNSKLREKNRTGIQPFLPYIKLLYFALLKLPEYTGPCVWCGSHSQVENYSNNQIITFWGFTYASTVLDVVKDFVGNGDCTLFKITTRSAVNIQPFSTSPIESEVLIPAVSCFQVLGTLERNQIHQVQLVETIQNFNLIDSDRIFHLMSRADTLLSRHGNYKGAYEIYLSVIDTDTTGHALATLGYLFFYGYGVPKNMYKAKEYLLSAFPKVQKSILDFTSDSRFKIDLGTVYLIGIGEENKMDSDKVMKWYNMAADQGNAFAQFNIGSLYDNGRGVTQDYTKAMEWYIKASDQGHALAQFKIGYLYDNGRGVTQDYTKAMEWYIKAADKAHPSAQFTIGHLYDNGRGVPQDYSKAMEWYMKAANQGLSLAQYSIGHLYDNGQGVTQDYSKAMEWYMKAANQGDPLAQCNIGYLYDHGQGVTQDYSKAMEWYMKAADQGHPSAQYNIGYLYENGRGVTQDYSKAMEWYMKAADQGHATAQQNIERLQGTSCIIL
eukprot:TRINITY_DN8436_c0_g1_i5.p1 TRINITY_DN8436_c0_g1~~TRINITY_DN8436_c0_g1_i5.p1  ORF type:complete len:597 (-),score=85.17 TRINITY_DN8436_c0_g1_i5:52-1842(-)